MLQNLRDNMKGTLIASVVFILFIVPLVLTGVGDGAYFGSVAGNDAATVDGKNISNADLRRAIYMRKQQLLSQPNADPNSEQLKDENLRGPVLENLTRRAAIIVAAEKGGMGVSAELLDKQIVEDQNFHIDGKFDPQTYRRLLQNFNFTPATYKEALSEDRLVGEHARGISLSAFATDSELESLVSLVQQKRSFFTVKVPQTLVKDGVSVGDEEIQAYYEENKDRYKEAEKASVQFVELSVADIATTIDVSPEDVRKQYEAELKDFNASTEVEIAHILIEEKDNQATLVEEVSSKLAAGDDFAELVKQYSDDSGSKESGGSLGVLTAGVFPVAFETAAFALEQDQVSDPVVTDAGIHFIKVLNKTKNEAPSFDDRKAAIETSLKTVEAENIYAQSLERLEELTFSAPDLADAASELGLKVQTTPSFTRTSGAGIASNKAVRDAAFSDEVLKNSYNSSRIELSSSQSIVLRLAKHSPERIKDLEEVKVQVTTALTNQKIDEALGLISTGLLESLQAGGDAEALAKADSYEYKAYDKVERATSDAGFMVLNKTFSMALGDGGKAFDTVVDRDGSHIIVGLTDVIPGKRSDMQEQQFKGLTTQLNLQNARFETSAYESKIIASAEIDIR